MENTIEWAQLIEPDGTPNIIVTRDSAVIYCRDHEGWTWIEKASSEF